MTMAPGSTTRWKHCTQYVTLAVALYDDGTYGASITSYHGDPRKWERHSLSGGEQDATLAPAGLQALQHAAESALAAFWEGRL
jgi:hypothetical protein